MPVFVVSRPMQKTLRDELLHDFFTCCTVEMPEPLYLRLGQAQPGISSKSARMISQSRFRVI